MVCFWLKSIKTGFVHHQKISKRRLVLDFEMVIWKTWDDVILGKQTEHETYWENEYVRKHFSMN